MRNRRAFGLGLLTWGFAATVLLVVAVVATLWFHRPAVTVTRVIEGPVVQAFYATGTVRPRLEYPIGSNVAGIVDKVLVVQGQAVKKGQALAVVSDPSLQYQADKAKADLETRQLFADPARSPILKEFDQRMIAAKEMHRVAEQQQTRFMNLAERNAASANDRDQAIEHAQKLWSDMESLSAQREAKLRELQEDVQIAESADRMARENLDRQTLRSPVDGVVLDEPISQGTRVEINGHVMQIADVSVGNLIVRAAVDEENVAAASAGQTVKMTLYAFPDRTFDGIVEQKYPKANPDRRTFDVDVKFQTPEPRLQAGMTGELAFIEQTRERALIVPSQAVQNGAVWLVLAGKLHKAAAAIGIRSVERAEILGPGVRAGDAVLISPVAGLSEGQLVRIGYALEPKVAADLNKPGAVEMPQQLKK